MIHVLTFNYGKRWDSYVIRMKYSSTFFVGSVICLDCFHDIPNELKDYVYRVEYFYKGAADSSSCGKIDKATKTLRYINAINPKLIEWSHVWKNDMQVYFDPRAEKYKP